MSLRRAVVVVACVFPFVAGSAAAQSPEPPPCVKEFLKLRGDAQTRAKAIQTASERKAPAKEACALFNAFAAAEEKMLKYASDNSVWCGIPPDALNQMKQSQARTQELRTKVCRAAAAGPAGPPRPAAPSLSDALAAPVPNAGNIKTGRGTYDTLTGTPLGRQ